MLWNQKNHVFLLFLCDREYPSFPIPKFILGSEDAALPFTWSWRLSKSCWCMPDLGENRCHKARAFHWGTYCGYCMHVEILDQSNWICDFSLNGTKDLPSHVRAGFSTIWFRFLPGLWNEGTDLETQSWFNWWSKPECQSLNFPLVAHRVFWQTHHMP